MYVTFRLGYWSYGFRLWQERPRRQYSFHHFPVAVLPLNIHKYHYLQLVLHLKVLASHLTGHNNYYPSRNGQKQILKQTETINKLQLASKTAHLLFSWLPIHSLLHKTIATIFLSIENFIGFPTIPNT